LPAARQGAIDSQHHAARLLPSGAPSPFCVWLRAVPRGTASAPENRAFAAGAGPSAGRFSSPDRSQTTARNHPL